MAWSAARPLTRLSDARNSYVIELAKYSAILTSPSETQSTMMRTEPRCEGQRRTLKIERRTSNKPVFGVRRSAFGVRCFSPIFISASLGCGQDHVRSHQIGRASCRELGRGLVFS